MRLLLVLLITGYWMVRALWASRHKGWTRQHTARLGQRWARSLNRLTGIDVEVDGPRPPTGVMLVANHRSYADVPAIIAQVPCAFLAKVAVSRWPLLGAAARLGNTVFVDRGRTSSRRRSRDELAKLLRAGLSVMVFAEGTTHCGPGMLPLRRGVFRLAAQLGVPLVPIAIEYAHRDDAWVGDATFVGHFLDRFARPSMRVQVHFGPLLRSRSMETLHEQAQTWISQRLEDFHEEPGTETPRSRGETTNVAGHGLVPH